MNSECLVIGDLNIDFVLNDLEELPGIDNEIFAGDYDVVLGGSGSIFTSVLSLLGIETAIISKIGNDYFGHFLLEDLKKNKADASRVIIDKKEKTGVTVNLSYRRGKSQISSIRALNSLKANDFKLEKLQNIRHVHFSSYYVMTGLKAGYVDIIKTIKSGLKHITFSLDTNDDPSDKWGKEIYKILEHIDILLINKKEASKISGEKDIEKAMKKLSDFVNKIVVKAGIEGYFARIDGKEYRGYCRNKNNKNFVDSTGAGDNFDAAFIYGLLGNFSTEKTLEFANYCAEKSIEYFGGVGPEEKYIIIKKHPIFNSYKKGR